MRTGTLTPEGARLLRAARAYILEHPDEFDMSNWCGTACCIAGHVCRAAGDQNDARASWRAGRRAARLLGFGPTELGQHDVTHLENHPLSRLFYFKMTATPQEGAKAINTFLWHYGYPPDEIVGPIQQEETDADTPMALAMAATD